MKRPMLIIVGLLLIGLAYSSLWFRGAFDLERKIRAFAENGEGMRLSYQQLEIRGFPYRFVVHFDALKLASESRTIGLQAKAASFTTHLWTPDHFVGDFQDLQFNLNDHIALKSPLVRMSLRKREGYGQGLAFDFSPEQAPVALQIGRSPGNSVALQKAFLSLRLGNMAVQDKIYETSIADYRLNAESDLWQITSTGSLSAPGFADWSQPALSAWRDAGGLFDIHTLTFIGPDFKIDAEGSSSLDESLKPLGSFSAAITGAPDKAFRFFNLAGEEQINREKTGFLTQQRFDIGLQNGWLMIAGEPYRALAPLF